MAGTPFIDGPAYVSDASDDIYQPSSNTYALVKHIHLVNTTAASKTVALWITTTGAETASTEILKDYTIAAYDVYDMYFPAGLKLTTAASSILVGDCSAANSVTVTVMGELYAA